MTRVGRSLVVFGWYLACFGALLVAVPNATLAVFGLPPTDEVWIRVVGVLVLVIAYFHLRLGREASPAYARVTVQARVGVLAFLTTFALAGLVKPIIIVVGLVDLAGAVWTALALRLDAGPGSAPPSRPTP